MKEMEFSKGERVSALSMVLMTAIGIFELTVGFLTGSLGLIGDGVDSFADATTSLLVWVGLHISRRGPDGKFHFGYFKAETLYSMLGAIVMGGVGLVIIHRSYTMLFIARELRHDALAIATALIASAISTAMLVYKIKVARESGLLSMRVEVFNSATDSISSIVALMGVILASQFSLIQLDSAAGIIVGVLVIASSYMIIRESSLILMDACSCGDVREVLRATAMSVPGVKKVGNIRLRQLGPFLVGDIGIFVDSEVTIGEANEIAQRIEEEARKLFDEIQEIMVKFEPLKEKDEAEFSN